MDAEKADIKLLALAQAQDREWLRMEVNELKALLCAICGKYDGEVDIPIRNFKAIADSDLSRLHIEENLWNSTIRIEYDKKPMLQQASEE